MGVGADNYALASALLSRGPAGVTGISRPWATQATQARCWAQPPSRAAREQQRQVRHADDHGYAAQPRGEGEGEVQAGATF